MTVVHRQGTRVGRQKGVGVYITAAELRRAGIDPEGPPPAYHIYPGPRRGVVVSLYARAAKS